VRSFANAAASGRIRGVNASTPAGCANSGRELAACAEGIRRDLAAVQAACALPWSQGQTEGQVNRLNRLKRQMYGRAKFDLLRLRVLYQPAVA
jgi:transposase